MTPTPWPATAPAGPGPPGATTHVRADRSARRLLYVDSLRVCAIALVFVIHVCEPFNPWDEWHITNAVRSRVVGEVVVLMAPWIMPLVMLLAGVSSWYSLRHRGNAAYVRERTLRLLLPLVVGTLVLVPPQVWLERRFRGQFEGSFLAFYPTFFHGIYPSGNFSWHHLWFLAHLYAYSLLALPLFRWLQHERGARALDALARIAGARTGWLWLALPFVLERSLLWSMAPERHMLAADWSNHAILFVAYVYGFVLAGVPSLRGTIHREWTRALALALLAAAAMFAGTWLGFLPARLPRSDTLPNLAFWALYALAAWAWMIAVLGLARRELDRDSRLVRYGNARAYAWYVLHQPIIVAFAFLIVPLRLDVGTKLAMLFVTSGVLTLVTTQLLGRMRRLLLGPILLASTMASTSCIVTRPVNTPALPVPPDLAVQPVHFASRSGSTIHAWFLPGAPAAGAVLLLHGVNDNRLSMVDRARFLHRLGYALLLPDFQSHGESAGDRVTFGALESLDAAAALAYLRACSGEQRIGVIGVSMGGAAALLGPGPLRADAFVLESVYPTIELATRNRLDVWLGPASALSGALTSVLLRVVGMRIGVAEADLQPIDRIGRTGAPTLVIAGTRDRYTPLVESRALFEQAPQPKEFWAVRGAGHEDLHAFAARAYERRVGAFLEHALRPGVHAGRGTSPRACG